LSSKSRFRVRLATNTDIERIKRFDARLSAGGRTERVSYSRALLAETFDEPDPDLPVFFRLMVTEEGDEIRAAALLFHQQLFVRGKPRRFSYVQMPISEGLVERSYSLAIVHLVKETTRRYPLLISLGVGSLDSSWARFVGALGWKSASVPFFFYPVRFSRVLSALEYLNQRPWLRRGARLSTRSGAACLLGGLHRAYFRLHRPSPTPDVADVENFGPWADTVFRAALRDYPITGRRDSAALNALYPKDDPRFSRLRVRCPKTGRDLGWIIVCLSRLPGKYFGDLMVGALADGFGETENVPALVWAGVQNLIGRGAEIIVSNWSHPAWINGSRRHGFLPGPSNYFSLMSPEAAGLVPPTADIGQFHIARGDSDGLNIFQAGARRPGGQPTPTTSDGLADQPRLPHSRPQDLHTDHAVRAASQGSSD